MGRVYRGYDDFGNTIALKTIDIPDDDDLASEKAKIVRGLLHEAQILSRLTHPHALSLLEFSQINNSYCLVTPFYQTTQDTNRLMELSLTVSAVKHIGDALRHVHSLGIIHNDIKPSSILITENGAILIDFGLAVFKTEVIDGDLVGSLAYMAPEKIMEGKYDHRADIYSFGCVVYIWLTGKHPFEDYLSSGNFIKAVLQNIPSNPSQYRDLPDDVDGVMLRALEKDPDKRQSTIEQFVDQFLKCFPEDKFLLGL